MSEDKNLNSVMDSEESNPGGTNDVILNEVELDEMTEALIETGEAEGNSTSEEVSEESSEESKDEDAVSEEVTSDSVPEEVVSLPTVSLEFANEEVITFDVDEEFQLVLRAVCQEQDARPIAFEAVGDISPEVLRLLSKAMQ